VARSLSLRPLHSLRSLVLGLVGVNLIKLGSLGRHEGAPGLRGRTRGAPSLGLGRSRTSARLFLPLARIALRQKGNQVSKRQRKEDETDNLPGAQRPLAPR
jgi:hypothetical protein